MIKMTYDEYDRMEEICEHIRNENTDNIGDIDESKIYYVTMQRPTLNQLLKMDIENHLEDYFIYLFFYYTQNFDDELSGDIAEYEEYKEMKAYLKKVIDRNIEFID